MARNSMIMNEGKTQYLPIVPGQQASADRQAPCYTHTGYRGPGMQPN